MNKQNLLVYDYNILYDILYELKDVLNFDIKKISKKDLNNTANEANNLVISKSDLNIQNQIKISQTPIELNKLLDQLKIKFLKIKIDFQKNIKIGKYILNLNTRNISSNEKIFGTYWKRNSNYFFLNKSKKAIKIEELQSEVWGHKSKLETHTVETHVYRLRKKILKQFKDNNFIVSSKKGYFIFWKKKNYIAKDLFSKKYKPKVIKPKKGKGSFKRKKK